MKAVFACKVEGTIGPGPQDLKEARVLNRVISWHPWGIRYEADPRHAEVLVRELQVQDKECTVTPGVKRSVEEIEGDEPLTKEEDVTSYRALAARANYLSLDRADICFAAKECCRHMSNPTSGDWKALRRIA